MGFVFGCSRIGNSSRMLANLTFAAFRGLDQRQLFLVSMNFSHSRARAHAYKHSHHITLPFSASILLPPSSPNMTAMQDLTSGSMNHIPSPAFRYKQTFPRGVGKREILYMPSGFLAFVLCFINRWVPRIGSYQGGSSCHIIVSNT